jgi:hypothetical protein
MKQKFQHAHDLRDIMGVARPILDFRVQDQAAFYKGLERDGPKAVQEFRAAFG